MKLNPVTRGRKRSNSNDRMADGEDDGVCMAEGEITEARNGSVRLVNVRNTVGHEVQSESLGAGDALRDWSTNSFAASSGAINRSVDDRQGVRLRWILEGDQEIVIPKGIREVE